MSAPLDTIGTIDTPPSDVRRARTLSILERLEALRPKLADHPASTSEPNNEEASSEPPGVVEEHASAWTEAVHLGEVRARRKAAGLDVSVRAIATEVGCSRGRAGELLQIRDAFNDTLLHLIGENDSQDGGHVRLARLSFRTLRSLARLTSCLNRIREVRRLSNKVSRPTRSDTATTRRC